MFQSFLDCSSWRSRWRRRQTTSNCRSSRDNKRQFDETTTTRTNFLQNNMGPRSSRLPSRHWTPSSSASDPLCSEISVHPRQTRSHCLPSSVPLLLDRDRSRLQVLIALLWHHEKRSDDLQKRTCVREWELRRQADLDSSWLGNESRHEADWSFLAINQMDLLETATAGTNDSVTVRTWLRDAFARRWELETLRLLKSNPFFAFFLEIMIKNTDSSTPEIIRHKTAPRASRKSLTCVALTDCESHERLSDEQRFQSWLECHASPDSDAATNWYFQKTILDCSVSSLSSTSPLDCGISSTTRNYKQCRWCYDVVVDFASRLQETLSDNLDVVELNTIFSDDEVATSLRILRGSFHNICMRSLVVTVTSLGKMLTSGYDDGREVMLTSWSSRWESDVWMDVVPTRRRTTMQSRCVYICQESDECKERDNRVQIQIAIVLDEHQQ